MTIVDIDVTCEDEAGVVGRQPDQQRRSLHCHVLLEFEPEPEEGEQDI